MEIQVIEMVAGWDKDEEFAMIKSGDELIKSSKRCSSSRQVFMFDDFVIKFDEYDQNDDELRFYRDILQDCDKKYFPKLIGSGYFGSHTFLIQERVKESYRTPKRKDILRFRYLQKKYRLGDLSFHYSELFGWSLFNCMMTREGLKIYDIGMHCAK